MTIGEAPVQARSPERAMIRLSCPAEMPDLCRDLMQALSEAATGGPVVSRVARGHEAPKRPDDVGVALYLDAYTDTSLRARLQWQGADAPLQQGSTIQFDVMDAPLSAVRFDRFARTLLHDSSGLVSALRPGTD